MGYTELGGMVQKLACVMWSVALLLTPTLAAATSADESWVSRLVESLADDLQIEDFRLEDVTFRRVVTDVDGTTTETVLHGMAGADRLRADFPGGNPAGTPAGAPSNTSVVAGRLWHHMTQMHRCGGYDRVDLGNGFARVSGTWDAGVHTSSPAARALQPGNALALLSAGVDSRDSDPLDGRLSSHEDTSAYAVGRITTTETFLTHEGECLSTWGTMAGSGVFTFDTGAEGSVG